MSLPMSDRWILKDKSGNPPPPNIETFIRKLKKRDLLPCPRTADDLQMPDKGEAPREMNNFIVFRRQLAHVAKIGKTSDDGRVISAAASFIWNGASDGEKDSYTQIAQELKKRHRLKYPNYTAPKVIPVPEQQQEPECVPIILEENERWVFNPINSQVPQFSQVDNNNFYYPSTCYDDECLVTSVCEENIPRLYHIVTNPNYTNLNNQLHMQDLLSLQQSQQSIQQFDGYDDFNFYSGISDMGINQTTCVELERPINEVIYSNYIE